MDSEISRAIFQKSYPDVSFEDPVECFGEIGSAVDALVYAWLFWPRLVEVEDAVFVAVNGDDEAYVRERLNAARAISTDGNMASWHEVVDSFNYFEIVYLFAVRRGPWDLQSDVVELLGRVLVETWSARLATACTERRFSVRLFPADESLATRVSVSQTAPPLVPPADWGQRSESPQ